MSEITKAFLPFEEAINDKLVDTAKENALDFVSFLRRNNMMQTGEGGGFNYLGKDVVCIMIFGSKTWYVYWDTSDVIDVDNNVSEELKKFAQSKRNKCKGSHCDKSPGTSRKIFGKEFNNICTSTMAFRSPAGETMENMKKLFKMKMKEIGKT